MNEIRTLVLYVRYGTKEYSGSFDRLLHFYKKHPYLKPDYYIVDNSLPGEFIEIKDGYIIMGGDNSNWEFSGFYHALNRVDSSKYDLVHFVTSAFEQIYDGYIDHYYYEPLAYTVNSFTCLGHVDVYPKECRIDDSFFQSWIRSCFYFMSPQTVHKLSDFQAEFNFDGIFDLEGVEPFLRDGRLSNDYIDLLTDWLTGKAINNVKWHSAIGKSIEERKRIIDKAKVILLEQTMSIRLRQLGAEILDIGFLNLKGVKDSFGQLPSDYKQTLFRKSKIFW